MLNKNQMQCNPNWSYTLQFTTDSRRLKSLIFDSVVQQSHEQRHQQEAQLLL